jgi:hypothetical protein
MTETTAKSGAAGTSTTPVDEEAADGGTPATGRAAVGRAAVPAEAGSPKFTRAPGMAPPPEAPKEPGKGDTPGESSATSSGNGAGPAGAAGPGAAASGKAQVAPPSGAATQTEVRPPGAPVSGGAPAGRAAAGSSSVRTVGAPPGSGPAGPIQPIGTGGGAGAGSGGSAVGAARVTEAVRAARSSAASAATRGPRRARLNLKRIDPWSVMKFSFAVSLVLFIVVIVATSVLYLALDAMGVFETVNSGLGDLISAGGGAETSTFRITAKGVIGTSALVGLVNVVLFTALCTLGAFIYNVCADLVGGVELTLAERD